MENANDKNKDFEHNKRMAEIHKKYERKNAKNIKIWKFIKKLFAL